MMDDCIVIANWEHAYMAHMQYTKTLPWREKKREKRVRVAVRKIYTEKRSFMQIIATYAKRVFCFSKRIRPKDVSILCVRH